ncbi:MAG: rod shape-determining protein MreD [Prevotellaceae bacterium]|jgi:rod shape-determining protein MreD|nr:rod shape-determining protein MreD [Prevotellaceae bacterium]
MNNTLKNILFAACLVAAQVLLFNNLQMRGMLNAYVAPCVYILYLLVMPVGTSKVKTLFIAFILGLAVDLFSGTLGMNAASHVLIGSLRPHMLNIYFPREKRDKITSPSIYTMGALSFLYYTFILVFIFHLALCFLEVFNFYEAYLTILRALTSAIASTAIMMIFQLLFVKKDNRYR